MHLLTIFAFACLLWRAETPPEYWLTSADDVLGTALLASGLVSVIGLAAGLLTWQTRRKLRSVPGSYAPHLFHHRVMTVLRLLLILGFAALVMCTSWPDWFAFGARSPWLQIIGDMIVLVPFVLGSVLLWMASYPLDRDLRGQGSQHLAGDDWSLQSYLDFHIRHQLLVVAVPMLIILFVADLTRGYEDQLILWGGSVFVPEVVLGTAAALVFVISPMLLCRIWRTETLAPGPVRDRLEALCQRINLRFRDILLWKSDGVMINAAVMGVFAPVRYVLLSDALLSGMTPGQVEAVFGHEAGHIRHRHITHFLVFAFVGWVVVVSVMEGLACLSLQHDPWFQMSLSMIEGVGLVVTGIFWGLGFGWVSRGFERQADLFGARCVASSAEACHAPCSVHLGSGSCAEEPERVCSGGAAVFASALERVAALNGIPRDEPSWRHGSIGRRVRFLAKVADDPACAVRFERQMTRVKTFIWVAAFVGGAAVVWYWLAAEQPAILMLQAGSP